MPDPLDFLSECRIAVIGDIMLDCYLSGDVSRISPEAPVPVMCVASDRTVPGGAGNVAANLASLGVQVSLVGLVGNDDGGEQLVEHLARIGAVDCRGLVKDPARRTTRKLRVMAGRQQIVRIDYEDSAAVTDNAAASLVEQSRLAIAAADAVIVSDYGKGACSDAVLAEAIGYARQLGKLIVVDPKRNDLNCYRGATILTPNRRELSEATHLPCEEDDEALCAAQMAREQCGALVLLTRSEKGMSFFPASGSPLHLATRAQAVFDVSGAGDTVIAVLTAALAANLSMPEAMRLANHAAGIVVSKLGTVVISRDELRTSLAAEQSLPWVPGSLVDLTTARTLRSVWAAERLTVGFTNGCFDLIHPGHVALIAHAAESCDRLIVAINSDASVRRLKGSTRPIQNERARAEVIGAMRGVAAVMIFDEETPLPVIEAILPDVLIKGADYRIDQVVGADIVREAGGRVVLAKVREGHSTSQLVAVSAGHHALTD